jgi:hypothetical protein
MLEQAFTILLTPIPTSLLTWALAYLWFKYRFEKRLSAQIKLIQDEFEQRVKNGVTAAAIELLPKLREQVREGFKEAIAQSPVSMVEGAARTMSKGADIVSDRLGSLFGLAPRK